jgi:hypothetical protein
LSLLLVAGEGVDILLSVVSCCHFLLNIQFLSPFRSSCSQKAGAKVLKYISAASLESLI